MSMKKQAPDVDKLAKSVDDNFSRPMYVLYFLWATGFFTIIGITVYLVTLMVAIGFQTGALTVDSTISSTVAILALMISITQYSEKSNKVEDDDFAIDCIKKNLKILTKKNPNLTEDEKLILSGLIKMKSRNEKANIQDVAKYLSTSTDDWIAFLYGLGDGSSLLKD
ncbi:MAG: hypothetical protein ACFFF9_15750 [Candidatus Thorarchaeota archaeon]